MDSDNLMLVVGTYADAGAAADDFATLKSGEDAGEYQVVGAVVMNRDASGKVEVEEHGDKNVGHGAKRGRSAPGSSSGCSRRRCWQRPRSAPGSAPGSARSRSATKRSSSASTSTNTCRRDPRRSWRSSTTSGPTRSRTPWSSRTRGSTRRSTRTTTTSCRRRSRSPPTRCRARSPRRSRDGGHPTRPAHKWKEPVMATTSDTKFAAPTIPRRDRHA